MRATTFKVYGEIMIGRMIPPWENEQTPFVPAEEMPWRIHAVLDYCRILAQNKRELSVAVVLVH